MIEITGHVEEGFGRVADAFRANFVDHGEVGAGFSLYVAGTEVVALTGGVTAPGGSRYDEDTLQLVFSTTKGIAAICAAMLYEAGLLDYGAPVSRYWPEFAAAGKEDLTVAWLMSHRCGLVTVDEAPSLEEVLRVDPIVEALAAQAPLWPPDGSHGYHAVTYGWLVGELVRRITGQRIGEFVQERIAGPLGLDLWIGLPAEELARVAPVISFPQLRDPVAKALAEQFMGPDTLIGRVLTLNGTFASSDDGQIWNHPDVLASEIPAVNGVTNAASLARMYAATIGEVDGIRLISDATREVATMPVTSGNDRCLIMETKFAMGFMCKDGVVPLSGPNAFGHAGAGGVTRLRRPRSGHRLRLRDEPDERQPVG